MSGGVLKTAMPSLPVAADMAGPGDVTTAPVSGNFVARSFAQTRDFVRLTET